MLFPLTLQRALYWLERWGGCVDFCSHLSAANLHEQPELFGTAEDDSFGPVVRGISCRACRDTVVDIDTSISLLRSEV